MASPIAPAPARTLLAAAAVTAVGIGALALPAQADTEVPRPDSFTSSFFVQATSPEVAGDLSGDSTATAVFALDLNSELNVLCYSVTTRGVEPPYMSPARTSTHIHEAPAGEAGPPRLVFADPASSSDSDPRSSGQCLQGPFTTGVTSDAGSDTGDGFTVAELEADPAAYYVDIHTAQFPAGSLRGQITPDTATSTAAAPAPAAPAPAAPAPAAPAPQQAPPAADQAPVGGVAAGFGGLSESPAALPATAALAAALVILGAGLTGSTLLRARPAPAGRRRS